MFARISLICTLIALLIPTQFAFAADANYTFTAQYRQVVPVQLDVASASEISTLDPALASDTVSVGVIENLFLGLTDVDPYTGQIIPELASAWERSDDGLVWTFTIRNDVQWLQYDPNHTRITENTPCSS